MAYNTQTLPAQGVGVSGLFVALKGVLPLWRYFVWVAMIFLVGALHTVTSTEVAQLRKDLDLVGRVEKGAVITRDRLRLEHEVRRRVIALESISEQLQLGPAVTIEEVSP